MKNNLLIIGGIISALTGYFASPEYLANPVLGAEGMKYVLFALTVGGIILGAIGGYGKVKES